MRKPSLTKRVLIGLDILASNPQAVEEITEIQRYNATKEEIALARHAVKWIKQMKNYSGAENARE